MNQSVCVRCEGASKVHDALEKHKGNCKKVTIFWPFQCTICPLCNGSGTTVGIEACPGFHVFWCISLSHLSPTSLWIYLIMHCWYGLYVVSYILLLRCPMFCYYETACTSAGVIHPSLSSLPHDKLTKCKDQFTRPDWRPNNYKLLSQMWMIKTRETRFRLTKQYDYFRVSFDHFWSKRHFFASASVITLIN